MHLPPQSRQHKYSNPMNTQSLTQLEAVEQNLRELNAEATDIVIKGKLNSALAYITTVLDEAFKDA